MKKPNEYNCMYPYLRLPTTITPPSCRPCPKPPLIKVCCSMYEDKPPVLDVNCSDRVKCLAALLILAQCRCK